VSTQFRFSLNKVRSLPQSRWADWSRAILIGYDVTAQMLRACSSQGWESAAHWSKGWNAPADQGRFGTRYSTAVSKWGRKRRVEALRRCVNGPFWSHR
jgi:hypothetical protein